ncbi:MAG TPA: nucleotidyltransferase domain-containing protein [Chloroflexi bacterium]|nr:nucleotidyltransferase domain-containing protein [Chloroflexota bacterium]
MDRERISSFLTQVSDWAARQPDILALALVGSHARGAATETSDVDLVILAQDPSRYLEDQGWLEKFGLAQSVQLEPYGKLTSIRVWYADGLEVEYGLTGEEWAADPLDPGSRRVMEGGMRVLFERGDLLSRHLARK